MGMHKITPGSPISSGSQPPADNGGFVIRGKKWQWLPFPGYYQNGYESTVMPSQQEAEDWGDALVEQGFIDAYDVYWLDPPPTPDTPKDGEQE